jgi:hypothetical protein
MTPYWIGRGTVEGALNAMPEGERRRALRTIEAALANLETQRVARALEREARDRWRPVTILTPGAPDAPALDVDTVAEITLLRVELKEQSSRQHWTKASVPDVNPMFDLVAVARLRVISRSDQSVLLDRTYHRRSGRTAQFADWSYNDAAEFQRARDEILDGLAADVALELFGAPPAPTKPAPEDESPPKEEEIQERCTVDHGFYRDAPEHLRTADRKNMTVTATGTNAQGQTVNNVAVFEKQSN